MGVKRTGSPPCSGSSSTSGHLQVSGTSLLQHPSRRTFWLCFPGHSGSLGKQGFLLRCCRWCTYRSRKPAPIKGKNYYPSIFPFPVFSKGCTINWKFFLKDFHFVPTAVNEAKGREISAGIGLSLVTHAALALSAESSWICLFSAPSMHIHRYTQGGVESRRRIFLYKTKEIGSLSSATQR